MANVRSTAAEAYTATVRPRRAARDEHVPGGGLRADGATGVRTYRATGVRTYRATGASDGGAQANRGCRTADQRSGRSGHEGCADRGLRHGPDQTRGAVDPLAVHPVHT